MVMPRSFTIVIYCILLLVLIPAVGKGMELTNYEQAYLEKLGKVTVCVDPDWAPFERINEKGEYEGIAADILALISTRTGIQFQLVQTKTWDESLEAFKNGKCMILSFSNRNIERDKWLIFTEPTYIDSNVFITREEHAFIADPNYFANETIVFPTGTAVEELFRKNYPSLKIMTVDTEQEALKMVSERKADMTMRSLITGAYTIKKEGLFNLKIAGQLPNYSNELRIGIVKEQPILRDILNKGISTITPEERWQIVNKHISINAQTAVDYTLVVYILIAFSMLAMIGFYWNYKLKKYNKELVKVSETDTLTCLSNRVKLDSQFQLEFDLAKRHNRPLSIIIFDVDNFKEVNDEFGHLMGDRVLVDIAQIAKTNIRFADTIGRWGGEEFLVICPGTTIQEALLVANRIRNAIKMHSFNSGREHTVSAGVAVFIRDDSIDSFLHRADTYLYLAKEKGKDRVYSLQGIC
jgi:diguanylate cyclase (GGDEF)-like protein